MRKQVAGGGREPPARTQRKRSRRPSPPEETPPQPSAAPNRGRAGLEGMRSGDCSRAFGCLAWDRKERGEAATAAGSLTCVRSRWRRTDGDQQSLGGNGEAETLSLDLAAHRLQPLRRHGVSSNHQPRQQGHHTHDDVKRCYGNR
ncbi:unnamed protein product [Rangifer tarandus platyrhynchus]|uniref:Uncharacterized protein n=2 Tax=Rangifer tarandus platyrhynchus TaxID=3082113 RepID=A0ACB0DY12_RANTA|nr:unnamed protein product [Rangifer tarandus platyrhynchus]CAI9693049.1 unnamed protein product [Rangifer tarandus platyrhynchus]